MGHKKLIRFEAIKSFSNVLQYPEGMPGKWNEFFGNKNDIMLELACGKGEYTVGLARKYPQRNFKILSGTLAVGERKIDVAVFAARSTTFA